MQPFLQSCPIIDWTHPEVHAKAHELALGCRDEEEVARSCFLFVRDHIRHSWDHQDQLLTCRANGIPAGLCYQRLTLDGEGPPHCLHGLNAIYLQSHGWYRIDARGNKAGVQADFCPPNEQLAFPVRQAGEADLPEIWPEPLPVVVQTLQTCLNVQQAACELPDIALWRNSAAPSCRSAA